jgi:hypothetical protein
VGDDEEGIPPTALREMSILKDLSEVPNIVEYVRKGGVSRVCGGRGVCVCVGGGVG